MSSLTAPQSAMNTLPVQRPGGGSTSIEQRLAIEHGATQALAESDSAAEAAPRLIATVCRTLGWDCGSWWTFDLASDTMHCLGTWGVGTPQVDEFLGYTRTILQSREPGGLIRRTWLAGEATWVPDVTADKNFRRGPLALKCGLHGAFAVPIKAGTLVTGVIEFFSREIHQPDAGLLDCMRYIGSQIGQFLKRIAAEEALRVSEARFRSFTVLSSDWYWEQDAELRFTQFEGSGRLGASRKPAANLIGTRGWEIPGAILESRAWDEFRAIQERREPFRDFEHFYRDRKGKKYFVTSNGEPMFDERGEFSGYRGISRDVTERRRREEELAQFRAAMDASPDMMYVTDRETMRFLYANEAACRLTGFSLEEFLTMGPTDVLRMDPKDVERAFDDAIAAGPAGTVLEMKSITKDGLRTMVESRRRAVRLDGRWIVFTISQDISLRKRAEQEMLRSGRMFAALSATNEAIMRATSPEDLYKRVCEAAVDGGKLVTAAVMIPDADTGWAKAAAVAGGGERRLRDAPISVDGTTAEGRGLVGTAYRSRQPCIINDFLNDERTQVWRASAEKGGVKSGAAIPLVRNGNTVGVLLLYSEAKGSFDEETVKLLQRMADNVAFALENFAREAERLRGEAALRESEERFRSLTELSSDWYWEQDAELRFTNFEGKGIAEAKSVKALMGKRPWELPGMVFDAAFDEHRARLQRREPFRDFEHAFRDKNGQEYYVSVNGKPVFTEQGVFSGYRGTSRDISQRKRSEDRIQYLATHDELTGLPNRVMFAQLLSLELEAARRYKRRFAVLFIDLDRFKSVNDTLGHAAGDALLKEMAERLKLALRASDVVARLGGDEFVVLVQEVSDVGQVAAVARKILSAAIKPIEIAGQECRVTASIGICMYPGDAQDEESLMRHADMAMYLAKESGKNNYQFYSAELQSRSTERLRLETHLRHALERNELSLSYQAKLDLRTNAITGVEALLRWNHPELGAVSPMQFIPVAEETGLIVPIGKWVLRTACLQNMAWQRQGLPPVRMAVNLSQRQFADPDLLADIAVALDEAGMAAGLLELEITESMVMHDADRAVALLGAIKALGVRLAIDDFGTGYSSLAQIKRFPIDTIKVDRSFIREIPGNAEDMAIAQAIIAMGRSLNLTVVAEGVETEAQQAFLREHACDEMQGYYFSKPVLPDRFAELLRSHSEGAP